MSKVLWAITILILSTVCVGVVVFMPLAELGLLNSPNSVPLESSTWLQFTGIQNLVKFGRISLLTLTHGMQESPNFQYYAYFFFLGIALMLASVALIVIGHEEPQEKTVLPRKK
ncbi:MAG: hypothetical protein HY711_08015 [Candidatus Melainabacteria bacterium]|nr:hypothetical protein [Candidatus Melainabacteria bacterium]